MTNEYEAIVRREIVTTRVFAGTTRSSIRGLDRPQPTEAMVGTARLLQYLPRLRDASRRPMDLHHARPQRDRLKNEATFVEIATPERIVIEHTSPPRFRLTALFDELGSDTKLTFRQLFETSTVFDQVKKFAVQANEDNLDRLAKLLEERR